MSEELDARIDSEAAAYKKYGWLAERMMTDYWAFMLVTEGGNCLAIRRITHITPDGWADVEFLDMEYFDGLLIPKEYLVKLITATASERLNGSINLNKIVAAFELHNS